MSLKAENDPNHNLNTLTDVVRLLGDARRDIKQVKEHQLRHDKRFDEHDKRFDEHDKRFDEHDKRFDQQDKELAALRADNEQLKADNKQLKADSTEIKEMLRTLLSR